MTGVDRAVHLVMRSVVLALLALTAIVTVLSTVELGWIVLQDLVTPPVLLLEIDELFDIFGFFLLVLIGVELLHTLQAWLRHSVVHVELVLEVALIAIARKVIVLDVSDYEPLAIVSVAALILTLAVASFLVSWGRRSGREGAEAAS